MILIAGATGYIGGLLADELVGGGPDVRCMARSPERAKGSLPGACEVVRGDVLEPETLDEALTGVELAYYLVHSMGASEDFEVKVRPISRVSCGKGLLSPGMPEGYAARISM